MTFRKLDNVEAEHGNESSDFIKDGELFDQVRDGQLLKSVTVDWVFIFYSEWLLQEKSTFRADCLRRWMFASVFDLEDGRNMFSK